ncbi:hypothetical protein [Paraburkholderia metrosideri]|uniref:hypothetical protein n=1 Tax=Paraburkholderia metrosideri TaxID=580937 RepID=UPI00191AA9C1|nr:hypothetical protein [Paraburkholderia metrosideri]
MTTLRVGNLRAGKYLIAIANHRALRKSINQALVALCEDGTGEPVDRKWCSKWSSSSQSADGREGVAGKISFAIFPLPINHLARFLGVAHES